MKITRIWNRWPRLSKAVAREGALSVREAALTILALKEPDTTIPPEAVIFYAVNAPLGVTPARWLVENAIRNRHL